MNSSRRLLWIAPHFRTASGVGGLRTWSLGRYLASQGHRVTVVTPAYDPLTGERLSPRTGSAARQTLDGVEVIRVWTTPNDRSRMWRRVAYFLSQSLTSLVAALRQPRPSLLIGANYPPTLAWAALAVARWKRVPFVLEVRDLPAEAAAASGYLRGASSKKVALALERLMFRRCQRIMTVAPGMKRRMVELGVPAERVVVIPNGYEEKLFAEADFSRDIRKELAWGDAFVVLYAGTLGHVPDIPTLLRTALLTREEKDILYVIVGGGQREPEYRRFCEENRLTNCRFLGRLPRREIPPLCKASDVCVNLFPKHPFWGCIFGNKNFDYMGSGTAYIYCGSEPSDTGDLLRESGGGLAIAAEDPAALREAILRLRRNPEERMRMGRLGREYVKAHYSRSQIDRAFETFILNEALGE